MNYTVSRMNLRTYIPEFYRTLSKNFFCWIFLLHFYIVTIYLWAKVTEMRSAIIKLHGKGVPKREIGRLLDVPESTVRNHINRYEETRSHQNKPKGKPKKTSRNRKNIQRAKGMIQRKRSQDWPPWLHGYAPEASVGLGKRPSWRFYFFRPFWRYYSW